MPFDVTYFLATSEEMAETGEPALSVLSVLTADQIVTESEKEQEKEKVKREKKQFLDTETKTVPVGSSIFNSLYALIARECQCRPEITPLAIAQLVQRFVGMVAVVIGENNSAFTECVYEGVDETLLDVSMLKLRATPVDGATSIFKYETIRPKRERHEGEDGEIVPPKPKKAKKAKEAEDETNAQ